MCTRYTLIFDDRFIQRFGLGSLPGGCVSRYNIAPGQLNPVIVPGIMNEIALMRWGLIPHWAKENAPVQHPVNARAETIAERPMFRGLVPGQRCLVPANGFYEWKKERTRKVPHYFRLKDAGCFSFAGLFDIWDDPLGEKHQTYTIITTGANALVAPIHDRMPAILTEENERRWLTKGPLSVPELSSILAPLPAGLMESYVVDSRVNSPAAEGESLIRPLSTIS